jgi:hypothetical protein
MPYDDETGHSYFESDEDTERWLNLYAPEAYYYASPADPHPGTIPIDDPMPDDDTPFIPWNPSPEFPLYPQCNDHHRQNAICFTTFEANLAVPLRDAGASIYKEGDVTGSSHQARIDEYFTRRPTVGVNRNNAHHECTHCGGVYHPPTQCPIIVTQAFNYAPRVKVDPIPIPPKPEEGVPTSSRYPERAIKPLPRRAREPRP